MTRQNLSRRRRPFLTGALAFAGSILVLIAVGIGIRALGPGDQETAEITPVPAPPEATTPADTPVPWTSGTGTADVVPPEGATEPTIENAQAALKDKRYLDAFDLFSAYVEAHPEKAWAHSMVGFSAWKAGLPEEAEAGFRAALERDPGHMRSRLDLARVVLDLGRPGEALDLVSEAARRDPRNPEVQRMMGRVQHNLGDFEAAAQAYRRAVTLDPNDAWAMNNLGYLYLEQERWDDAVPPLARAVEVAGTVPLFRNNLGIALERLGHFDDAAASFQAALDADPGNAKVALNLSRVKGRPEDPALAPIDLAALASRFATETAEQAGERADAGTVPATPPTGSTEP
jgi:Tfp pilus assembly protein PilF